MTDSESTLRLLDEAQAGSGRAYEQLIERHRPKLMAAVQRRLNPKVIRRVDAEDIVQETQLEAVRRRDDFLQRRPMPFSLWLLKTAHERLLKIEREHLKTAKRAMDRELPLPDKSSMALAKGLIARGLSPSHHATQNESARLVRHALAQMSELSRAMIFLRNFEGLSNREASQLLEISEESAKKRYTRAVLQLQQFLDRDGYTESSL